MFTRTLGLVSADGWQRARRSGLGRPTAFLTTSVMKDERTMEMAKERYVASCLWVEARVTML